MCNFCAYVGASGYAKEIACRKFQPAGPHTSIDNLFGIAPLLGPSNFFSVCAWKTIMNCSNSDMCSTRRSWEYVAPTNGSYKMRKKFSLKDDKVYSHVCCGLLACIVILIFVTILNDNRCKLLLHKTKKLGTSAKSSNNASNDSNIIEATSTDESADEDVSDEKKKQAADMLKDVVSNNKAVIVIFYAHWCSHCFQAMPIIKAAAKNATIPYVLVNSGKIESHVMMPSEYNVTHFPYICKVTNNKIIRFEESLSEQKMRELELKQDADKPPEPSDKGNVHE